MTPDDDPLIGLDDAPAGCVWLAQAVAVFAIITIGGAIVYALSRL